MCGESGVSATYIQPTVVSYRLLESAMPTDITLLDCMSRQAQKLRRLKLRNQQVFAQHVKAEKARHEQRKIVMLKRILDRAAKAYHPCHISLKAGTEPEW